MAKYNTRKIRCTYAYEFLHIQIYMNIYSAQKS